jgi:hypothetical protein
MKTNFPDVVDSGENAGSHDRVITKEELIEVT